MKKSMMLVLAVLAWSAVWAGEIWYVAPNGKGGGSDWDDVGDAVTLIAAARAGDEIRLKAGLYDLSAKGAASAAAVTLVGGWTGSGDGRGGETVFANAPGTGLSLTAKSGQIVLDSLVFSNCVKRGLSKDGAASLFVTNCIFAYNGSTNVSIQGRGAYFKGTSAARLDVVDSRIFENRVPTGSSNGNNAANAGQGFFVSTFAAVRIVDCDFFRNGQNAASNAGNWRDCSAGAALYVTGAPLFATNCTFRANRGLLNGDGSDGGILAFAGSVGGSVLDHCLFVGNSHVEAFSNRTANPGGAVQMCGTGTVMLNHCTVAYNAAVGIGGGIYAKSGTLDIRNSIVALNTCSTAANSGSDFCVAGGTVKVYDSVVTGKSVPYARVRSGTLIFAASVREGDPLFASTADEYAACLSPAQTGFQPMIANYFNFNLDSAYESLDIHPRSIAGRWTGSAWTKDEVISLAIDRAASDAPYEKEAGGGPKGGGRANAGVYGNTAEASLSTLTRPVFANVTAAMSGDGTRVRCTGALAALGADEDPYSADLFLCYGLAEGTGLEGWDRVEPVASSARAGEAFACTAAKHYANGTLLHWQIVARTYSAADVVTGGTIEISGTPPANLDRGGGADVIHVWAGAQGTCGGTDWLDACTNLADAAALVTATRTNIWIAGTVTAGVKDAYGAVFNRAVAIHGGFTAMEDSQQERIAGAVSVVNGAKQSYSCISLTAASGCNLVENLVISNSALRGLSKSGAASLFVTNCTFTSNGSLNQTIQGRGAYFKGTSAARLDVVDSRILDNRIPTGENNGSANNQGQGFYVESFAAARIVDCTFARNGQNATTDKGNWRNSSAGAALYVTGAPLFATNCTFRANRGMQHTVNDGGVVAFAGAVDGSVLDHCLFVDNSHVQFNDAQAIGTVQMSGTGTVTLNHCTVAYNASVGLGSGVRAKSGTLDIRNSIVAYNTCLADAKSGADFYVDGGKVNVYDSLVTDKEAPYAKVQSGTLIFADSVKTGDPLFVSTPDEYAACLTPAQSAYQPKISGAFRFDLASAYESLDVHLRGIGGFKDEATGEIRRWKAGPNSPAIDAANGDAPYNREPRPNGRCADMGFYGNTPWATCATRVGGLAIIVR